MVVSREVAASRLRRLEQCVRRLTRIAGLPLDEYLADEDARTIAERLLQVAAQCLLDLGNHIIAEEGLGTPEDMEGITDCLAQAGVVPAGLYERTRGLAGLRNLLVHDYLEIDHRTIHALLQRLQDLTDLGGALGDYVERKTAGPG